MEVRTPLFDLFDIVRLGSFHAKVTFGGKIHLSPLKNPGRVLDIGTGTGIWAIEFGRQRSLHPRTITDSHTRRSVPQRRRESRQECSLACILKNSVLTWSLLDSRQRPKSDPAPVVVSPLKNLVFT